MIDRMRAPKLRWPLDIQPSEVRGVKCYTLRDPLGVAEEPALVPPELMGLIAFFDGTRPIVELEELARPHGITSEIIAQIVADLDAMYFLETPLAREREGKILADYAGLKVRPAALAGRAYASDPLALKQHIRSIISETVDENFLDAEEKAIIGMISPHIDYHRGWQTYGSAFNILDRTPKPDLIVLMGTAHQGGVGPYFLTPKDFDSPLGLFPTDQDALSLISSRIGFDLAFREEILHRTEHSLELQLPFLAHRYSGEGLPSILPVIVGSFHHFLEQRRSPATDPIVHQFTSALAELIEQFERNGQRILFYAGVDLAHVGQYFGDHNRMCDTALSETEERDHELLEAVLSGDEEQLFLHMAQDCDQRRICGFPTLYTILRAYRLAGIRVRGELLEYRQASDPESDCTVSFASAYWTRLDEPENLLAD